MISTYNIDILGYRYEDLLALFKSEFNKKEYHAKAFVKNIYQNGSTKIAEREEFLPISTVARQIEAKWPLVLPKPDLVERDHANIKFSLNFGEGVFAEAVIIGMNSYKTLCISSQTGCRWGCAFCQTGTLGFRHNLSTAQIIAQYMVAVFHFNEKIDNIVFMGMGEALDNIDAVVKAIDLLCDPYAINIAARNITISTVGNVDNIKKLQALIEMDMDRARHPVAGQRAPTAYRNLRLAVSLNASNDQVRNQLMPVNRRWPMGELKKALEEIPLKRKYHDLFLEYVLIPGLTDGLQHALELVDFLKDFPCVVNLIPYNEHKGTTWRRPTEEEVDTFFKTLVSHGQVVRRRHEKGSSIGAACGQLGVAL